MPGRGYQLDDCVFQSGLNFTILKCQVVEMCCFVRLIFRFWFLVTWQQSYENMKILRNLCLHFARQDGQNRKKPERKSRN